MLLDPNSSIVKKHGKYAGPLAETEVHDLGMCRSAYVAVCGIPKYTRKKKKKKLSPQGGSNSRPLVYETSALPLSYRGTVGRVWVYLST